MLFIMLRLPRRIRYASISIIQNDAAVGRITESMPKSTADIILQLIQRDLARNESGFSSNILVLDEILDNLDAIGADSVIRLLEYKSPDIDSMLIVSHKQDITIPSDRVIKVVKSKDQLSHISKGE